MAGELQEIIDVLATAEGAITPPTGGKDVMVFEEPPTSIAVFPSVLNIPRAVEPASIMGSSSVRHFVYVIDVHLVTGLLERKYSSRELWPWVEPFFDALDKDNALTGAYGCEIRGATFDPLEWPPGADTSREYEAINFELAVSVER